MITSSDGINHGLNISYLVSKKGLINKTMIVPFTRRRKLHLSSIKIGKTNISLSNEVDGNV